MRGNPERDSTFVEKPNPQTSQLRQDISEKNNLADKMPEKASELKQMLYDWRIEVGALMPRPKSGSGKKSE